MLSFSLRNNRLMCVHTPTTLGLGWAGGLARRLYRIAEADNQQRVSKVLAGPAKPFVLRPENAGSSPISSADETMSLCPLPRPSSPAGCGADPQVLWSKGKCGHAFYERPCDDKKTLVEIYQAAVQIYLPYILCLNPHLGWRPRVGLGRGPGQIVFCCVAIKARRGQLRRGQPRRWVCWPACWDASDPSLEGAKMCLGVL